MPDASAPTERASDRVDDDVRHRPGDPAALPAWLHRALRIDASHVVADLGSGTGISTRTWLAAGHPVVAVEDRAVRSQADFGYDTRVFAGTLG